MPFHSVPSVFGLYHQKQLNCHMQIPKVHPRGIVALRQMVY